MPMYPDANHYYRYWEHPKTTESPLNLLSRAASTMGAQPAAYERETTLRSPVIPSTSSPTRPTPPYTILAAFPQLSTSSSVPTIPVTPEMEITLSRPLSKSKRGKVTTSRKRNDKYRMKYIYLSMTRAAAHRYISELASASNLDLRARYVEVGAGAVHPPAPFIPVPRTNLDPYSVACSNRRVETHYHTYRYEQYG